MGSGILRVAQAKGRCTLKIVSRLLVVIGVCTLVFWGTERVCLFLYPLPSVSAELPQEETVSMERTLADSPVTPQSEKPQVSVSIEVIRPQKPAVPVSSVNRPPQTSASTGAVNFSMPTPKDNSSVSQIVIDAGSQSFTAYDREGKPLHSGPVTSGTSRDETGRRRDIYDRFYIINGRDKDKVSNSFRDKNGRPIPMPYALQLEDVPGNQAGRSGLYIHQGEMPGYPASHGCFRLHGQDARWLYESTPDGTIVEVRNAPRAQGG